MVKKIFRSITIGPLLWLVLVILSPLSSVAFADTIHITGTVTDQNGTPISGVAVLARIPGSGTDVSAPVGTAVDGTYDLALQPGSYDILFGPPSPTSNLGPAIVRSVAVQSSQVLNAQLTSVQHTFSGTVVDKNNIPIPNLQVRISSGLSGQTYRAFTTSTGSFTVTAPAGYYDIVNFGGLTNSVTLEGYPLASPSLESTGGANSLTVDTTNVNMTQNFTLNFVKLTITVKDSSGNPKSGQYVHTRYGAGSTTVNSGSTSYVFQNNGNNYGGTTGADGTYTAWVNEGAAYPSGTICLDSSSSTTCDVASNSLSVTASTDLNLLFQGNPPVQVIPPTTPASLSAQSPTNQAPMLTWTASSGVDHYVIYRDGGSVGSTGSTTYSDFGASEGSHVYYVEAVNIAGMSSDPSNSVTVVYDTTAPTISYSVSQAANTNGWNNSDVTVTFTCSDNLSGIRSCPSPITTSAEGANQSVTGTAIDNAGNTSSVTANLSIDKTAPTITASVSSQPNGNRWNNTPVTVTFTCGDVLSGIASCTSPVTVTTEGQNQVITGTAVDKAGNVSTTTATVSIDRTNPMIVATQTPAANAKGWNNSNVTISYVCSDALSGIQTCPSPVTVSIEGANQTVTGTATDKAGNSASVTSTINLDKTPPTISSPTMSNTFIFFSANETLSANAGDGLSGVTSGEYYIDTDPGQGLGTVMTYSNGKLNATKTISGLSVGQHKLYMRSKDMAGNWSAVASVAFTYF